MSEWTNSTPTKAGFYWCHDNYQTRMVKIWGYAGSEKLFTNEDGGASINDHQLYKGVYWSGPLEPPEPPKELLER